jgi:hypothetical protein
MNVKQPGAIVSAYYGFGDDPEPEVQVQRPSGERMALHGANLQLFLTHDAPAAHRYQLDTAALQAVSGKIVPAAGVISRDSLPYRCAQALARLLGRELHEFPGGHSGYVNRAQAFGEELHHVLAAGS